MKKALKLHHGHVRLGKPLPWNVYDDADHLLLTRGYVVEREAQLESLLERGMYVDAAEFEAIVDKQRGPQAYDPFWVCDDIAAKLAFHLLHAPDPAQFQRRTEEVVTLIQGLTQRSGDAAIAVIMLTVDHRRYPIAHSLQVAMLCEMLTKRLGWESDRRTSLLCAALTMNLGMLELQQKLSNQRDPLTPEQRQLVRAHPAKSVSLLHNAGVDSPMWLAAVEAHHETSEGTGYPTGSRNPTEESVLLRTLDIFCAKVSPRLYRKPMSGTQAERILYSDESLASGNVFIPALIKELGVYPPGSFVKLANGEVAIVVRRMTDIRAPLVASITNTRGEPVIEPIRRDTSRDGFQIVGETRRDAVPFGFNPARFWQENNTSSGERKQWG